MTTLKQIHDAMWRYNQAVAYGSECNAWADFVADCYTQLGVAPWTESDGAAPSDFVEYWQAVADGKSDDYTVGTGDRANA